MAHDPEVAQLTGSVRRLTGQAMSLSREINGALEELTEFRDDVVGLRSALQERRSPAGEYPGTERRQRD